MVLLALALVIAQFGIVSHSLHLDAKQDGNKTELSCAFCIAGSHLATTPVAPVIDLDKVSHERIVVVVQHVCDDLFRITPRLTRGPPRSTT